METFESPKFKSSECRQSTERTYETYIEMFNIPEKYLENRGNIIDIGSGFSNFSTEVNKRFGNTGTRAYALDPIYTFFDEDFNKFKKFLEGSNIHLDFNYGRIKKHGGDRYDQEAIKKVYDEFYKEATESGSYIAGSHQNLPFKNESVDLIIGNNSIIEFKDPEIVIKAFNEIVRILKQDGEIRIRPARFWYLIDTLRFDSHSALTSTSTSTLVFENLKILESKGVKFYISFERDVANKPQVLTLILRKDNQIPQINTNSNLNYSNYYELSKLDLSKSRNENSIESDIINLGKV